MKKTKLSLIALSACMLLISACGGNNNSQTPSSNNDSLPSLNSSESSESNSKNEESSNVGTSSTPASSSTASSSSSVVSSSVVQSYKVEVEENLYATITLSGETNRKEGDKVSFKVTLKNANVVLDSVSVSYGNGNYGVKTTVAGDTYTFTMPNADVKISVKAHEEEKKYNVSIAKSQDYTITLSNSGTSFIAGTNIVFTAISNVENRDLGQVVVTKKDGSLIGVNKGENNQFSFAMPESDVTISASLEEAKYTVSLAEGVSNVYLSVIGMEGKFVEGTEVSFNISAAYGYKLGKVTAKGAKSNKDITLTKPTGSSYYNVTIPAENVLIYAEVEAKYTITTAPSEHVTISVTPNQDFYEEGSKVTFTASTSGKYIIDTVSVTSNGKSVAYTETNGSYSFIMPKGNVTISATEKVKETAANDPFTQKMTFEGSWEQLCYGDWYTMRLRVIMNGDGTMSYYLSYDYDSYEEYWTNENTTISGPVIKYASLPSGMQGSYRDSDENVEYVYDSTSDIFTANLGYKQAHKEIRFQISRNATTVTSITALDNLDSDYWAIANHALGRI